MASLGSLVVNLTANTSQFNKNIAAAQTRVQKFGALASQALKVGATAGLAAVGVAAAKTAQQFSKLDMIAKTSDKLGIATQRIAGLNLAFEQTGVDANAGMIAMQRMTRRVSDAAKGSGPAVKALQELGLSAATLNTLTPDKMLGNVADAMKGVANQGDKVRLAFSLFDSEGVGLVNTLAGGSTGLQKFQQAAEQLNLTHTREELSRIEKANDAMIRMSKAVTGSFQKMAIIAAPVVEKVATGFEMMTTGVHNFAQSILNATGFADTSFSGLYASMTRGVTVAYTTMNFGIENWQKIAELALKQAALGVVTFGSTVSHFFTQQLPGYLSWFGKNWHGVFFTAFDFVATGFINVGKNIRNTWASILDYIKGNTSTLSLTWTPLLDGFKNTMAELPNIPPRAIGQLESKLMADISKLGKGLGGSLTQRIADNLAMLETLPKTNTALPKFQPIDQSLLNSIDNATSTTNAAKTGRQFAGFQGRGSSEAMSTILKASGGGKQKEESKQTAIQKKMVDLLAKIEKKPAMELKTQDWV